MYMHVLFSCEKLETWLPRYLELSVAWIIEHDGVVKVLHCVIPLSLWMVFTCDAPSITFCYHNTHREMMLHEVID